jgi:hypothetical protein
MDTVTVETSELIGPALDWAVAKCEGFSYTDKGGLNDFRHLRLYDRKDRPVSASVNWSQGGPIIERELIRVIGPTVRGVDWIARIKQGLPSGMHGWFEKTGPTPLIAAMRCYVASNLGDTVQIPRELVP